MVCREGEMAVEGVPGEEGFGDGDFHGNLLRQGWGGRRRPGYYAKDPRTVSGVVEKSQEKGKEARIKTFLARNLGEGQFPAIIWAGKTRGV